MRVMMVSKALVVAAYRQKLAELARLGVEVTAVVPPSWRDGGFTRAFEEAADAGGYQIVLTPVRFNGHFHVHYYPELPQLLRQWRPDLLHIDEEPYNVATFLGALTAKRQGTPSLFFSWQNLLRHYPPPFSAMERAVFCWSRYAIAGSEEVEAVLRARGYSGPLSVVPQFGVDVERFHPATEVHEGFNIGFLNRLTPGKAPHLAVEAFRRLPRDARLWIVGDGPLRSRIDAAIQDGGIGARVVLRNTVTSCEMPELIRHMDAVILPSVTTSSWKEQFGRVLVEAMACGVPVVGSTSGEIPRVVGDAGLIVPEGDVNALAGALQQLYDNRDLCAQLGRRGRARVLERYTHARIAEGTYAAYSRALSSSGDDLFRL